MPTQLLTEGVTIIVAITGTALLLTAVNAAMFPVPMGAKPMDGLLLVQLKVGVPMVLVKLQPCGCCAVYPYPHLAMQQLRVLMYIKKMRK